MMQLASQTNAENIGNGIPYLITTLNTSSLQMSVRSTLAPCVSVVVIIVMIILPSHIRLCDLLQFHAISSANKIQYGIQ
jgi:hypothetical protein